MSFLLLGAGSAVTIATGILDSVSGVTGAWSVSRDLLGAFAGNARYTDAGGGAISSLNGQVSSRHFTDGGVSTRRPALSTAGPNSIACLDFDGSSDFLSNAALSTFMSNSAGYLLVSFIIDVISANNASFWNNHAVMGDNSGSMGIYIRNTTGSPETAIAGNFDGSANGDQATSAVISTATAYVAEWWHDSGSVFLCVNNGTPVSVASGNTSDLTTALKMGAGFSAGVLFDGKIFESYTASAVPAGRSATAADFMSHIGAV